jgi:hypothetical protein
MRKPKPETPTNKTQTWIPASLGVDLSITVTAQQATMYAAMQKQK